MKATVPSEIGVLIAEPLSIVRTGLRLLVESETGLAVVGEADNGEDLPQLVARLAPDVLVLEPDLPGPPAAELIPRVLATHPRLKVMVLAAPQRLPAAATLLDAGAGGCVLKSDRPEEFLRGIRAVAGGELVLSSTVARSLLSRQNSQPATAVDALTGREREILSLLTSGLSNKEIAQQLYLSVRTVEVHLRNLYGKLGVRSRLEAVTQAARPGSEYGRDHV